MEWRRVKNRRDLMRAWTMRYRGEEEKRGEERRGEETRGGERMKGPVASSRYSFMWPR